MLSPTSSDGDGGASPRRSSSNNNKTTILFNKYEMGRLLGQGSFAKVHYGRDLRSGDSVAIKVINKDLLRREGPGLADQIQREISVLRLLRHPHIVELKEVMATRARIFVVMEYVRGGELFARVARGRLPEPDARRYFQQLISAVDYCHSRGVSHRDLKPENLLLDENGDLKVSDFGLSALIPDNLRGDGMLHTQCGTPAYVAPEVLRRRGYDGARADLWSCGVVLFVLLAGHLPFQHENLMTVYSKIFRADYNVPPWFSSDARRVVARLLVPDPDRRISVPALMKLPWFKKNLSRSPSFSPPPPAAAAEPEAVVSPRSYNAFELISTMSSGFDLSGLFEERRTVRRVAFTARRAAGAVVEALEKVGRGLGFGVERGKGGYGVRMEGKEEGRKGKLAVAAEVFEVAPEVAVVEFCKASGDTLEYVKFCQEEMRPGLKDIVWAWQGEKPEQPSVEVTATTEAAAAVPPAS